MRIAATDPSSRFDLDYTFFLNVGFVAVGAMLVWLGRRGTHGAHHRGGERTWSQWLMLGVTGVALAWLAGGLVVGGVLALV
ncbi:MAG: hypothetical protein R2939_05975 [Kofleriaceae bacterium]